MKPKPRKATKRKARTKTYLYVRCIFEPGPETVIGAFLLKPMIGPEALSFQHCVVSADSVDDALHAGFKKLGPFVSSNGVKPTWLMNDYAVRMRT